MNETHFNEIERVLMNISGAKRRADKARAAIAGDAEPHLEQALQAAADDLERLHKKLMQSTYFAVPSNDQQTFAA